MDDVIVIGAGPAGLAAANYTVRHHLKTRVIAPDLAGKAAYRLRLPWMHAHETITGEETVELLRQQLLDAPQATRYLDSVEQVFRRDDTFQVHTTEGGVFDSHAVIVATGVSPRVLGVPGEQRLLGYGLTYSAVSHAPLFAGRRVVVVGDNLRALRAAAELRTIAEHVTLVAPEQFGVSGFTLGRQLLDDRRVTALIHHQVVEIMGERYVSGIVVAGPDGAHVQIPAEGVFIEHGLIAHTGFVGALVERTPSGHIIVDDRCATRCAGLFAAGDITNTACAEQILIALGEGVKAGIGASTYLREVALIQAAVPS
jgi:NADH-dependent peroxiredoxin subunit F